MDEFPLDRSLLHVAREHRRRSLATAMWTVALAGPYFSTVNGGAIPILAQIAELSERWYGLIQALPALMMLIQLPGSLFIARLTQRSRTVFLSGFVGRLMWIPVTAIPLVFSPGGAATTLLIVLIALAWMGQHISGLTWQALMGDLVPSRRRGKYFGKRVRIFSATQLLSTVVVALTLPAANQPWANWILFAIISVASGFGALECWCYRDVYDPPRRPIRVKLGDLSRPVRDAGFRPFLVYGFLIAFSNGILAPFLWRHLLGALSMAPFKATLILQTAAIVGTLLTAPLWGFWVDRHGTKAAMVLAIIGAVIAMLAWPAVTTQHWWVGLLVCLVSSGFWAGVDVSLANRLFAHGAKGGAGYFAMFNAVLAIGGFASTALGGELMEHLQHAAWIGPCARRFDGYGLVFNGYMVLVGSCITLRVGALYWLTVKLPKDKPTPTVTAVRLMAYQMHEGITGVLLWPIRFIRKPWVWR